VRLLAEPRLVSDGGVTRRAKIAVRGLLLAARSPIVCSHSRVTPGGTSYSVPPCRNPTDRLLSECRPFCVRVAFAW
jgi:hypothetical protein